MFARLSKRDYKPEWLKLVLHKVPSLREVQFAMPAWTQFQKGEAMTVQFSVVPDVRSVINTDGGVLLNLERGVCYSLNGVGARVWSMLAESHGLQPEAVIDRLATQFVVPRQRLAEDVVTFLRALENKGLVHAAEAKSYAAA